MKTQSINRALLINTLIAASVFVAAGPAQASQDRHDHAVMAEAKDGAKDGASAHSATEVKKDMTAGEVKKLMTKRGKISIKHEEIKSLDMPPMTMVFKVKDPAMLEGLAEGDQIEFAVDGDMVIESIQKR